MPQWNPRRPSGTRWPATATRPAGPCGAAKSIEFAHRDGGAYQLFVLAAGSAAAFADPQVFRAIVRRNGFLDRTAVLDEDADLQTRIEDLFAAITARPRPAPGPPRDQLLATIRAATAQPP
jgi:hypothetical protein